MLCNTIGDELKLLNTQSKVYGIALKDRSAILPAGHAANGAFWFDAESGNFISSTYYASQIPGSVSNFNKNKYAETLLKQDWNLLLTANKYQANDSSNFEAGLSKTKPALFPYHLPEIKEELSKKGEKPYELLRSTPFGTTITTKLALHLIEKENLGKDNFCDLLCISYSSTDYIGHRFGPQSLELEDMYIRMDRELAELLNFLDKQCPGEYLVFLSSDHGAASIPGYASGLKIPAKTLQVSKIKADANAYLEGKYESGTWISAYVNQQFYLNHALIESKKIDKSMLLKDLSAFLKNQDYVQNVIDPEALAYNLSNPYMQGYFAKRSGDLLVSYLPGYIEGSEKGTTHGSAYTYDTHVPLIFYGKGVKKGRLLKKVFISDIAPSICYLLGIQEPNCAQGNIIEEMIK